MTTYELASLKRIHSQYSVLPEELKQTIPVGAPDEYESIMHLVAKHASENEWLEFIESGDVSFLKLDIQNQGKLDRNVVPLVVIAVRAFLKSPQGKTAIRCKNKIAA